jgi:phosphoglycolate phosphatase
MYYTHLFFDLDGTLTDSKQGIFNSALYAADKLGIPADKRPADMMPFIGPPLRESFKLVFNIDDETAELATTYYREYYGKEGMYQYSIYDGIPEVLETLATLGYNISVVTSKAEFFAKQIISKSPLKSFITNISGCELNGNRSEKEVLIPYNANKLKVPLSKKILMIGDRLHDIRGARSAGISSAGVLYGFGSLQEITTWNPDLIIPSANLLAQIIHSYNAS